MSDSQVLRFDSGGKVSAQSSVDGSTRVVLKAAGDTAVFRVGEPVRIDVIGLDLANNIIKTDVVSSVTGGDNIVLSVVPLATASVHLTQKCQTVFWYDPYEVPRIEIGASLPTHQIVCTPVFDDDCVHKGYEIRFGNQTTDGCSAEAEQVLRRRAECQKKLSGRVNRRTVRPRSLADIFIFR